jgi:peptide/nickel transport system substrate-binding protein
MRSTTRRALVPLIMSAVLGTGLFLSGCTPGSATSDGGTGAATATQCLNNDVDLGSTEPSGVLTLGREGNTTFTRNFNPFSPNALWPTLYAMYEPLFALNLGTGEPSPRLATEWSSSDANVVTFNLREGVNWSDGEPFTAADVIFSLEFAKDNLGQFGYVTDITAVDDTTVEVTLDGPNSPALYLLGTALMVPEHIWKDIPDPLTYTNEDPVATGPLTEIAKFQTQEYQVDRNPDYWDTGKPYIQGVRVPAFPGNPEVQLALANGEIDWADVYVPDVANTYVARDADHNCYWGPYVGDTAQLYLNTTMAPYDDPDVRKAISMAINRDQVVSAVEYGEPANNHGIGPKFQAWQSESDPATDWTIQNVEQSKAMLDAAGLVVGGDGWRTLPDGSAWEPTIIVGASSTDWVASSQSIVQNLKDVGINASVKAQDWGVVIDEASKGDFSMAHMWSSGGATPYNFYRGAMSTQTVKPVGEVTNENFQRYGSPAADALLSQFEQTNDVNEQKAIVTQLGQLFADEAPSIPLYYPPQFGEYNTTRFVGFPSDSNPYADPNSRSQTASIVLTTIRPVK